jgi:two-component system phosphate regulon response regulator PhoB/two-component system alkaline phosphatase synthesis response regulator PhoP
MNSHSDDKEIISKKVFILEDEKDIAELVAINLQKAGFKTKEFLRADRFFSTLKEDIPDLLILDLMLPDMDGLEVCKQLRKNEKYTQLPIIMLTAKAEELDKIIGLELGADDYVTKPFSPRELVARVKAVIRRENTQPLTQKQILNDNLEIDFQKYEVRINGEKSELTTTEFKILKLLVSKKGWVFSRNQILDYIDSNDKGILDRTVDVHIKNLREKLKESGKLIKNVRGIGYKFEDYV